MGNDANTHTRDPPALKGEVQGFGKNFDALKLLIFYAVISDSINKQNSYHQTFLNT